MHMNRHIRKPLFAGTTLYAGTLHHYYPIPERTTPFDSTLHPHYLPITPSTQEPHPLLEPFMCVCVIGGVLYDRIEVFHWLISISLGPQC